MFIITKFATKFVRKMTRRLVTKKVTTNVAKKVTETINKKANIVKNEVKDQISGVSELKDFYGNKNLATKGDINDLGTIKEATNGPDFLSYAIQKLVYVQTADIIMVTFVPKGKA